MVLRSKNRLHQESIFSSVNLWKSPRLLEHIFNKDELYARLSPRRISECSPVRMRVVPAH